MTGRRRRTCRPIRDEGSRGRARRSEKPGNRKETTMQSGWLEQFHRRVAAPKTEPETAAPPDAPAEVSRRDVHPERAGHRRHGRHGRRWHARPGAGRAGPGVGRHADRAEVVAVPLGPAGRGRARSNRITPAKVLEAAKLIKTGKIYEIGRVYQAEMPLFGARVFAVRIPGTPTGGPVRQEQARLPRRVRRHGDRPGRHAVRRARPHRLRHGQGRRHGRDALLQRVHRGRDRRTPTASRSSASRRSSRSSRAASSSTWRASRGAC